MWPIDYFGDTYWSDDYWSEIGASAVLGTTLVFMGQGSSGDTYTQGATG